MDNCFFSPPPLERVCTYMGPWAGADPSIANAEGNAAIHHACQSGKPYVTMILLDAGASPHLSNAKGETPLDVAALYVRVCGAVRE